MAENEVRNRALGAILTNAVLSWQMLVTLVVTGILILFVPDPFPWWQSWFWAIGGAIAAGAFVISNITDPEASQEAVAREFEGKYDLRQIKNNVSRGRLERSLEYRRSMLALVKRHSGAMRTQMQHTIADVNDWIAHMYDLALHIDGFESNELVERDRRTVPQQLEKARLRLQQENDDAVRRDLEEQCRQLELQLTNLEATASSIKRAEIQLDSTLSSLGTVYAQMSLLGTKEVDSSRTQRLRQDIKDEVASLQDTIEALDEVQAQRLRLQ
jgi:hypothetical protein